MKHRPIETPWGPSQHSHEFAPGIVFYSTASHGGYHLSTERWKDFTAIPQFANWPSPWLEEDCDASLVYLRWPEMATDEQIHDAVCMVSVVSSWGHARWKALLAWLDQQTELLARAQAHLNAVAEMWQRGSMGTTKKPGVWWVHFRRGNETREVYMDYPTKRYYSDEELNALAKPSPETDKYFNDRHDARVAAGKES